MYSSNSKIHEIVRAFVQITATLEIVSMSSTIMMSVDIRWTKRLILKIRMRNTTSVIKKMALDQLGLLDDLFKDTGTSVLHFCRTEMAAHFRPSRHPSFIRGTAGSCNTPKQSVIGTISLDLKRVRARSFRVSGSLLILIGCSSYKAFMENLFKLSGTDILCQWNIRLKFEPGFQFYLYFQTKCVDEKSTTKSSLQETEPIFQQKQMFTLSYYIILFSKSHVPNINRL